MCGLAVRYEVQTRLVGTDSVLTCQPHTSQALVGNRLGRSCSPSRTNPLPCASRRTGLRPLSRRRNCALQRSVACCQRGRPTPDVRRADGAGVHPIGMHADGVQYTTASRAGKGPTIIESSRAKAQTNVGGVGIRSATTCRPTHFDSEIVLGQAVRPTAMWPSLVLGTLRYRRRQHQPSVGTSAPSLETYSRHGAPQQQVLRLRVRRLPHLARQACA